MFTGLVEALGTVGDLKRDGAGCLLEISAPLIGKGLQLGESVAVNGVCLTVVDAVGEAFCFQVGPETLRLTNLGELQPGMKVNLERSLKVGDRLGGHIVQGHVDGIGTIEKRQRQDDWDMVWIACAPELTFQMVRKGSIAVDGISLTLVDVAAASFSVALIPHTLAATTLGFKGAGETVNLETDLFAKYVSKYLEGLNPLAEPQAPARGNQVRG